MLAPPQQAMEMEQGAGTSIHSTTQSSSLPGSGDPIIEGLISIGSTSSSSSPSSSSSRGSFDLLLELNNAKDDNHEGPAPILKQGTPRSPNMGPIQDSIQANNWNPYDTSVKQSSPVQTMGRSTNPSGYDPNRIPSSIFSSKPTSPMDWSVASNESLFSIHMGNNSFSQDHAILMGKSGELYKFDDLISSVPGQQPKPNEVNNSPFNLPTVIETTSDFDNHRQSVSTEEDLSTRKGADVTPNAGMRVTLEVRNKEMPFSYNSSNISDGQETSTSDGARTSASNNRFSTESGATSSSSFAFPVLIGEAGSHHRVKTSHENVQPRHVEKPMREPKPEPEPDLEPEPKLEPKPKPQPQTYGPNLKAVGMRWFSWFRFRTFSFSFPRRCSWCC